MAEDDLISSARLLELTKAYPALWRLLERYDLEGDFLRLLREMHETAKYVVRGKEVNSDLWKPERGLTEGCPSLLDVFNIYHQALMRIAEKARKIKAEESGRTAGIGKMGAGKRIPI